MGATREGEINRVARLGQSLEDLVLKKVRPAGGFVIRTNRDDILIRYWSLIFDYSKGIVCLLHNKLDSSAFALLRPTMETVVRAHLILIGSEEEVMRIRQDRYSVNYEKDGKRIDEAFFAGTLLFEKYLKTARSLLHSLTHSGMAQLSRRIDGEGVGASFSEEEVAKLLGNSAAATFLITVRIATHYGFEQECQAAQRMWLDYGALNLSRRAG
jgi:hypothetical protein